LFWATVYKKVYKNGSLSAITCSFRLFSLWEERVIEPPWYEPYLSILLGCGMAGACIGAIVSWPRGALWGGVGASALVLFVLLFGRGVASLLTSSARRLAAPKK
jgi:hypothetical protein